MGAGGGGGEEYDLLSEQMTNGPGAAPKYIHGQQLALHNDAYGALSWRKKRTNYVTLSDFWVLSLLLLL
jgi:hypothetical protein